MIPELGEVREVEQLAASDAPSYEGAWWIMLQTAESICNYASRRDPINNAFLSEFWTEAATEIENVLAELSITTPTAKDKGKIMKELMPRVKGKADGKMVNTVLASMM